MSDQQHSVLIYGTQIHGMFSGNASGHREKRGHWHGRRSASVRVNVSASRYNETKQPSWLNNEFLVQGLY
jgi:hypothetical protein